jgi:hypothetical protein
VTALPLAAVVGASREAGVAAARSRGKKESKDEETTRRERSHKMGLPSLEEKRGK